MTAVTVTLREITDDNLDAVLALRISPEQEQFVSSVQDSLAEAAEYPEARPWYRAPGRVLPAARVRTHR